MKITIQAPREGEEEEIIIRAGSISPHTFALIEALGGKSSGRLVGYVGECMEILQTELIFYFEAVDNRVFAYCDSEVYEVKQKLYEIEELLCNDNFFRASKSTVLNISKIKRIAPLFNGRFEALLKNGEKTVISRQYVSVLKQKLGI
ncbi:MAG: LytTR family transcriptional regulator DNA-binding domain-containing protein [Oscillospiraceae bacterium]|jgi:DNA-binding LytR/AlgR family response regulator|nr:LytTR family transcriptional regulator DNA-binding domain-containing protein [Oscillospiraceae bacterium]